MLVLAPLALTAAVVVALDVAGLALAVPTVTLWIALPWLMYPFALPGYRDEARDIVLPLVVGLTPERGHVAATAIIVAAALLAAARARFSVAAGAALGVGAVLVPATLVFGAAATVALLAARRRRDAILVGVAVATAVAAVAASRGVDLLPRSQDEFVRAMGGFREYFWSQRLVQWLPIAGAIGLARRSPAAATFLGVGFVVFAVVQSARADAAVLDASLFRLLLPGFPAFVLLFAAVPLLVPTLAARLGDSARPLPLR